MTDHWAEWGSDHELVLVFPRLGCGYVYVAWGQDSIRPLYIGKAVTPAERVLNHIRQKPWAKEVVRWEVHGFPSEELAELAETEAIAELNPIHNVTRRWTQAQWAEFSREFEAKEARKAEARQRAQQKPPRVRAEPVVSPHPRKRLRRAKCDDDLFTPDQLEIIARVQGRRSTP